MFKRTLLAQTAMLALISIAPSQATILDRDVTRVKSLAVSRCAYICGLSTS